MGHLLNIPENNIAGIYAIVNNMTGKMYIGESSQLKTRANSHLRLIREKKHSNKNLANDLQWYNDFSFVILKVLSKSDNLEKIELEIIKRFLLCGYKLYNCDTIDSVEKRLRVYERWEIYNSLAFYCKRRKFTRYQFVAFSEERQQREIQKVCEILKCQPGQIMEYIPLEKEVLENSSEDEEPAFMRE